MPPRSFFPKGGNLQLKTVPSCPAHNNAKSGDDQYLLAHISMHTARGGNLAQRVFLRSIAPQLKRSVAFRENLARRSVQMGDGAVAYPVDVKRFDHFFDHLCYALYFDRYRTQFDDRTHSINHCYLSLSTSDPDELQRSVLLSEMLHEFHDSFPTMVEKYEADRIDELVYQNRIIDPAGVNASITMAHTFYGLFDVVSLLTRRVAR